MLGSTSPKIGVSSLKSSLNQSSKLNQKPSNFKFQHDGETIKEDADESHEITVLMD